MQETDLVINMMEKDEEYPLITMIDTPVFNGILDNLIKKEETLAYKQRIYNYIGTSKTPLERLKKRGVFNSKDLIGLYNQIRIKQLKGYSAVERALVLYMIARTYELTKIYINKTKEQNESIDVKNS